MPTRSAGQGTPTDTQAKVLPIRLNYPYEHLLGGSIKLRSALRAGDTD